MSPADAVIVLLSTYDLGRQPFGLASPAAWLRRAGVDVHVIDLSRDRLYPDAVSAASLVAFYLPMHTATRLALPMIDRVRAINPAATICAYGLYAPLNEAILREHGVSVILGPEAEEELVSLAVRRGGTLVPPTPRATKAGLKCPSSHAGASSLVSTSSRRIEPDFLLSIATRRCRCRTAPRRSSAPRMPHAAASIAAGIARSCRSTTGSFASCPLMSSWRTCARKWSRAPRTSPSAIRTSSTVRRTRARSSKRCIASIRSLTYDAIIKVEHLLAHRELLPVLAKTGCLFVTSAVESVDDRVLEKLEKGHTRADFITAAELCRSAGLTLVPTFVAFTPWTTVATYVDLLNVVDDLGLTGHVSPVQLAIRLLVTWQSRLLELPDIQAVIGPFDPKTLTYPWQHPDPRVDELQRTMMELANAPRMSRSAIPYMNEPWYC